MIKIILISLVLHANYGYTFKLFDENIFHWITGSLSKNINIPIPREKESISLLQADDDEKKIQYKAGQASKEVTMNITELIQFNGFNVETHQVETEDGYILNMFRIPGNGPAIFLMHGLTVSADDWVTAGRNIGLAYLIAEKGYDVWMGNARGCKHSKQHKTLSPDNPDFWDFTYYEIGVYDLPAMLDYVLEATSQSQLFFVGHSQGAASFFVMCAEKPEYNSKINFMVALGPAGAIPNAGSKMFKALSVLLNNKPDLLFKALRFFGHHEFKITGNLCQNQLFKRFCHNFLVLTAGQDTGQIDYISLPIVRSHTPSGASIKQIELYAQSMNSGKFCQFDYGKEKNLEKYGSETPPEFDLKNVIAPIAIFYGKNDQLAAVEDVLALRANLPNVVLTYEVPYENFGHLDFIYAKDLRVLVFSKLLELIEKYV